MSRTSGRKKYILFDRARVAFYVLPNGNSEWLRVAVNGRKKKFLLEQAREMRMIVFNDIRPRCLHQDYIYSIEIATHNPRLPIFLVCVPEFISAPEPAPEEKLFAQPQTEPLPALFAAAKVPDWCREVYRVSGIDFMLHRFVQTERLFSNHEQSGRDTALDDFPLAAGRYLLRAKGRRMDAAKPVAAALKLKWGTIGLSGKENGEFNISPAETDSEIVRPLAMGELTFVQLAIQGQVASNFQITEISIEPDYLGYINGYWLKK